jgi:L-lactate dehydrogenase complex protein LldE
MPGSVALFATCLVDQLFPRVGLAIVEILERLGWRVNFPGDQTCCGQPAFNSGFWEEARPVMRHFLKVFRDADYVVIPSGSCTAMIRHHYAQLAGGDPQLRRDVDSFERRTYEFSEFLLDVAQVEDLGAHFPAIATYHDSCHALRELKIKDGPRRLLSHVRGLELREMDIAEECCGFGGTFSVKFADLSGSMARTKIASILRSGADTVISIDSSCLMQLDGVMKRSGVSVRAVHLAEVLASR